MIKEAIKKVVEGQNLSEDTMIRVMNRIMDGRATDAQIASLLTALRIKGETVEEISGAAKVMRAKSLTVPVASKTDLIDIVGTGGDCANTFNISTAAAFVACGCGLRVAKHGNRSVSSNSGSADVMEQLGVSISISPESVGRCIDEVGIGFLFAQKLHSAMRHAAAARNETGIRTIFNILGPLTNPADADILLVGVYEEKLTAVLAEVLRQLGKKRALVVHGRDGLDEITLCADTTISELKDGKVSTYVINPEAYGLTLCCRDDILGGTPAENAKIILRVLEGEKGPRQDIVLLNAGAAVTASGKAINLADGITAAAESIDSGRALQKLTDLKKLTGTCR